MLVATCFVVTAGCGDTPASPTPVNTGPPILTCPAAVSQLSMLGIPLAVTFNAPTVTGGLAPIAPPACTPASGSTFGQGTTNVSCTAVDAAQKSGSCTFTVTVNYPPRLTVTRFIAFGDSMTWGEDGQYSTTTSIKGRLWHKFVQLAYADTYPGALQIDLVGRYALQSPTVYNDGAPGEALVDPTAPALARFKANLAVGTGAYDAVLIMEGANDLMREDATLYPAMISQLSQMIDFARGVGVKPYLATLPPENPNGSVPIDRGRGAPLVPDFDNLIRTLTASKGVPLVDVYQAFNGNLSLVGPDGLHLTADGYHLVAQTFLTSIEQTLEAPTSTTAAQKKLRVTPRNVLPYARRPSP